MTKKKPERPLKARIPSPEFLFNFHVSLRKAVWNVRKFWISNFEVSETFKQQVRAYPQRLQLSWKIQQNSFCSACSSLQFSSLSLLMERGNDSSLGFKIFRLPFKLKSGSECDLFEVLSQNIGFRKSESQILTQKLDSFQIVIKIAKVNFQKKFQVQIRRLGCFQNIRSDIILVPQQNRCDLRRSLACSAFWYSNRISKLLSQNL